ncbi:hypothetical protein CKA32_000205 [Geitlerinema sp. FC II]|nr:hypothetical protein CKA32_000205 [Geitlerinema sp. FC II]
MSVAFFCWGGRKRHPLFWDSSILSNNCPVWLPSTLSPSQPETTTQFSIWPELVDLDELASLSPSSLKITNLSTCIGSRENASQEAPSEATEEDTCPSDLESFSENVSAIAVDMKFASTESEETTDLRLVWRYLEGNPNLQEGPIVLIDSVVPIPNDLDGFIFTLGGGDRGFPRGRYDLIVFPKTQNAVPIYRTVEIGNPE